MTVIAACVDSDNSVWMGADTLSIDGQSGARAGAASKVFRHGEMLIGSSGTVRCHQIVECLLGLPPIAPEVDLREWMIREFCQPLRHAMKEYGGECKGRDGGDEMDGRLLVGVRGSLFLVDAGYGIWKPRSCFTAIGCADQEALSGMFVAVKMQPELHARRVVELGLEAAAEYDTNIRPPFEVLCDQEETNRPPLGLLGDNIEHEETGQIRFVAHDLEMSPFHLKR